MPQGINDLSKEVETLSKMLIEVAHKASFREEARLQICDMDIVHRLNGLKLDHLNFKTKNFMKLNERASFKVATEHECSLAKMDKRAGECRKTF